MTISPNPGDRIRTKSGRTGTIQPPTFAMPVHVLVEFAPGQLQWVPLTAVEEVLSE